LNGARSRKTFLKKYKTPLTIWDNGRERDMKNRRSGKAQEMRLIDADKLKQSVTNEMFKAELNSPVYFTLECVIADIDNQPTAYDVDKVVEKLEKITEEAKNTLEKTMDADDFCNLSCEYNRADLEETRYQTLCDVMELIKSEMKG